MAEKVEQLLVARSDARSSKDWGKADEIRDQLNSMGVVVVDTPDGPSWKLE